MKTTFLALALTAILPSSASAWDGIIYFTADWCPPCRQMKPIVKRMKAQGYNVYVVDIDNDPDKYAKHYKVKSIPCFVAIKTNKETRRLVGAQTEARLKRLYPRE